MDQTKVQQDSVVKQSVVEPPRQLAPQFQVDEKGRGISEQEIIERRERVADRTRTARERAERIARWQGLPYVEILRLEIERIRPGTMADDTFSISEKTDGSIDVHFMGRVFRVLKHVVAYSIRTSTWHITAQGALDRLRTAAVRPDVPREVKQADVYEEQAELLREVAKAAQILDDEELQSALSVAAGLGTTSIRWKTEVQTLFLHLIKRLQEKPCQTSQPQPPRQPKAPPGQKPPAKRRHRRKAGEKVTLDSREGLAEAGSRTTSPS